MIHDFVDDDVGRGRRDSSEKKRSDEEGSREKSRPGIVFAGWTGDALMRHRDQSKAFVKLSGRTRQRMKDISQRNAKQLARHVVMVAALMIRVNQEVRHARFACRTAIALNIDFGA